MAAPNPPQGGAPVLDECQACGACCFSPQEHYVRLSGEDHLRLTEGEQAAYTVFHGNRCFMRMEGGRCAALAEVPGGFACRVYERRPQLCRDYELAGPACAVDRERQRLPVLTPDPA